MEDDERCASRQRDGALNQAERKTRKNAAHDVPCRAPRDVPYGDVTQVVKGCDPEANGDPPHVNPGVTIMLKLAEPVHEPELIEPSRFVASHSSMAEVVLL